MRSHRRSAPPFFLPCHKFSAHSLSNPVEVNIHTAMDADETNEEPPVVHGDAGSALLKQRHALCPELRTVHGGAHPEPSDSAECPRHRSPAPECIRILRVGHLPIRIRFP